MNPFDFRGPDFLTFYIILVAILYGSALLFRRVNEPDDPVKLDYSDPYLIAFLRGGSNEALRVAVVTLIDAKLLTVEETKARFFKPKELNLVTAKNPDWITGRRPLENVLLEKFRHSDKPTAIFNDAKLNSACNEYQNELERLGLLPDASLNSTRMQCFLFSLAIAWGVAVIKIGVALSRGRHNIDFLIILSLFSAFLLYRAAFPVRTRKGDRALEDTQALFSNLKERSESLRAGTETTEASLLVAIFGVASLPGTYGHIKELFPKAASSGGGSACGSSCGGGCGGGGCGGGCGGCGG